MEELKIITARNILNLRTANKMTQMELGEKLNYSDKAVSKWERAEAVPDAYILKQMSEIFSVSVDYILGDHENDNKNKKEAPLPHSNYATITKITIVGVWAISLSVFIVFWLFGRLEWLVLAAALPISAIVLLVLNSIWGKLRNNRYIISLLVWSILAFIYLLFFKYNIWMLFLLGLPSEIIIYLSFKLQCNNKS